MDGCKLVTTMAALISMEKEIEDAKAELVRFVLSGNFRLEDIHKDKNTRYKLMNDVYMALGIKAMQPASLGRIKLDWNPRIAGLLAMPERSEDETLEKLTGAVRTNISHMVYRAIMEAAKVRVPPPPKMCSKCGQTVPHHH